MKIITTWSRKERITSSGGLHQTDFIFSKFQVVSLFRYASQLLVACCYVYSRYTFFLVHENEKSFNSTFMDF